MTTQLHPPVPGERRENHTLCAFASALRVAIDSMAIFLTSAVTSWTREPVSPLSTCGRCVSITAGCSAHVFLSLFDSLRPFAKNINRPCAPL